MAEDTKGRFTAKEKCLIITLIIIPLITVVLLAVTLSMIVQLKETVATKENLEQEPPDKIFELLGWYRASNGFAYRLYVNKATFEGARQDCQSRQARLASTGIRSAAIRSEIWTNVMHSTLKSIWIGLNQPYLASGNDTWVWSDGATYSKLSTPWNYGQPDNSGFFF